MVDKPILVFPTPTVASRGSLPPARPRPMPRPTQAEQAERLTGRFLALSNAFGAVQASPEGIDPEQVIVLETAGSVEKFQNAVKRIPGMEWLGDFAVTIDAPEPGFLMDGADATSVPGRLFVVLSKRAAFTELITLWNVWCSAADERLAHGYGPLAAAFKHLNDVRPWGPKDRVATGAVEAWEHGLETNEPTIRFEAELWCRKNAVERQQAYARFQAEVTSSGGRCITQLELPEIDYHGVLLDLPASTIRAIVDSLSDGTHVGVLRIIDVKYFAPRPKASIGMVDSVAESVHRTSASVTAGPVVALLDGLPLENHVLLQGHLQIDDPDNLGAEYQVGEQWHGTAMASLIVHGDLDANEAPLASRVYVRPVMAPRGPDANGNRPERFHPDRLIVDVIHRAVRRIFEGDGDTPAQASTVKVINLSLGDADRPFDGEVSPWARLLDWLSWKYRVLFIVSAGNHSQPLTLPIHESELASLPDADIRAHTLRAMADQGAARRLLAPAETVNGLCVGAVHGQAVPPSTPGTLVDLLRGAALPSPISPLGSGFRKAIKPDLLNVGGLRHYRASPRVAPQPVQFAIAHSDTQPGQLVASPGGVAVPPKHNARASGTSNAAALTTRNAALILQRLGDLRTDASGDGVTDDLISVVLKAMLVHGASWNGWESFFEHVFDGPDTGPARWWRIKKACARFLGYGIADFHRGTICSDERVIVLGCGELPAEGAHVYNIPIPPALHAQTIMRRMTVTLAWLTPVAPRHRSYLSADLWFDAPGSLFQATRRDANDKMVRQGTVQHEVFEGDAALPVGQDDTLPIQVNCRGDATPQLESPAPYALVVSLEVAQPLGVSIYDQVKVALDRIRARVPVAAGVGGQG